MEKNLAKRLSEGADSMCESSRPNIFIQGKLRAAGKTLEEIQESRAPIDVIMKALTRHEIWVLGIIAQSFGWTKEQVREEVELGKKIMKSR